MKIIENEPLAKYTTFKVGGKARYFGIVKTVDDIKQALDFASQRKCDYFILAGGSNLIVSDDGYDGLVLKLEFDGIKFQSQSQPPPESDKPGITSPACSVSVGAGTELDELVDRCNEKGLKGLEWAGGLPGSVGGAVRGNAGAFGGEIKDCVLKVKTIKWSSVNYELSTMNNQQCQFGYRTSAFKHNKEIILEVELQLQKGDPRELQKIAKEHRQYRKEKHPIEYGCAGSIFKNVPLKFATSEVAKRFGEAVKTDPFPVIPTAAVIAAAGLKGYTIGNVQVSQKHPNYIINLGGAKSSDIIALIEHVVKTVKQKYGIFLEVEPQLLGFSQKFPWESR